MDTIQDVKLFCKENFIDIPNLSASSKDRGGQTHHQVDNIMIEHHYRVDIFYVAIDSQLQELNTRFSE